MTQEEYRNHVHTIVDLVMDIQEIDPEHKPVVSVNIYSDVAGIMVWEYEGKGAKQYTTRYQKKFWDTPIEKLLEKLQNIKAELVKKKSSASDQTRTELN